MMEQNASKITLLKLAGALGVLVPLLAAITTATFQYMQFVKENRDNNFRLVVEQFASEKPEHRLAAATNLSVYLQDPFYKKQALDILINMTAIELDTNVLSAIRSSLDNLKENSDKQKIIQKLLALEQSTFTYKSAMREWERLSSEEFDTSFKQFIADIKSLNEEHNLADTSLTVGLMADANNIKEKAAVKGQAERQSSEIAIHGEILGSIIQSLLNNTRESPIEDLNFFQNTLNYRAVINARLVDPVIINSALSRATLSEFELIGQHNCQVFNTTFENSLIADSHFENCDFRKVLFSGTDTINSSFSGSSFSGVLFYQANIRNTDFSTVKGLLPEYFYGSRNYREATFNNPDFADKIAAVTSAQYLAFIRKIGLSSQKYQSICKDIKDAEQLECLDE